MRHFILFSFYTKLLKSNVYNTSPFRLAMFQARESHMWLWPEQLGLQGQSISISLMALTTELLFFFKGIYPRTNLLWKILWDVSVYTSVKNTIKFYLNLILKPANTINTFCVCKRYP